MTTEVERPGRVRQGHRGIVRRDRRHRRGQRGDGCCSGHQGHQHGHLHDQAQLPRPREGGDAEQQEGRVLSHGHLQGRKGQGASRSSPFLHQEAHEVLGINTRRELAGSQPRRAQRHTRRATWRSGVTITDRSVYIEADVHIEADTVISPYCYITGKTQIGTDALIGPHVVIKDSVIGKGACIEGFAYLDGARVEDGARVSAVLAHHVRLMLLRENGQALVSLISKADFPKTYRVRLTWASGTLTCIMTAGEGKIGTASAACRDASRPVRTTRIGRGTKTRLCLGFARQ